MTTGPDGQPQVYQATTTTRTAPGGVREVHQSVSDSRSGVRKMAVGRHLGDRGHVLEKEENVRTGDLEEREDFINIDEGGIKISLFRKAINNFLFYFFAEEAQQFNEEWQQRAAARSHHAGRPRLEMSRSNHHHSSGGSSSGPPPLAITAGPSHHHHDDAGARSRHSTHPRSYGGPDRSSRRRDGQHRSGGRSRHETSM